jgi:hypothetical protein
MRYFSLIIFARFLVFCVDFATQNTETVIINYQQDWLNLSFRNERPVFVPIFFTFAFRIIFCVIYFFIYHSFLLGKLSKHKRKIKRLSKLDESHNNTEVITDERKGELDQIVASVHDSLDNQDDLEPPELHKKEEHKTSA